METESPGASLEQGCRPELPGVDLDEIKKRHKRDDANEFTRRFFGPFHTDRGALLAYVAALEEANSILREALEDIEASHLPDQPAESHYDERGWAMMWIGRLRGVAKVALESTPAMKVGTPSPETLSR